MNNKLKYFKTATIQERVSRPPKNSKIPNRKWVSKGAIPDRKFVDFWIFLPKKIVRSHGWKKGDEIIFIPIDSVIETKPGDILIRRWENGNKERQMD